MTTTTSAAHLLSTSGFRGWMIADPDGNPAAFYAFRPPGRRYALRGRTLRTAAAALRRHEPNAALRNKLLTDGWSVRAGNPEDLFCPAMLTHLMSA